MVETTREPDSAAIAQEGHDGPRFWAFNGPLTPEKLAAQRATLDRAERVLAAIQQFRYFRSDDPGVTAH